MRQAIIKLIEKWAYRCDHDWSSESRIDTHVPGESLPTAITVTYRCTKCCEFKSKKL